ncbi:hypothetical protein EV207_13828 [Scopulibacillus darangshiensis]|uniref:Uncharacterized protein n=1 Tax=Scopulibacillus darangshiensis TaxID=442528 RepID=A0A4R2NKF6_9BACL|nr:hypothetical protein [Scopulibacillus darangshiensis]TCP21941.1 hypothetical protein EV207_13828 [Scopulibacillus darangshiensis]
MSLRIVYNGVELMTALDNAGVFNGENEGYGWSSHFKSNNNAGLSGTMDQFANNELYENINIIKDNDYIDAFINDQDVARGEFGNIG